MMSENPGMNDLVKQGPFSSFSKRINDLEKKMNEQRSRNTAMNLYPVDTVYMSSDLGFDPGAEFGGTWTVFAVIDIGGTNVAYFHRDS